MNFHVLTLFPEMIMNGLETSILGRAAAKGIVSFEAVNIRDYTLERHGKVDDYPYGGGAGMVMQAEPIYRAYEALDRYHRDVAAKAREIIAQARRENRKIIVLAGRPYHIDKEINHGIHKLVSSLGMAVITEDSVAHLAKTPKLGVLNQWTYHSRLYRAAEYVTTQPDMQLIQLVSFGCGIDAVTGDEVRAILESKGKLYTQLKIDEINNLGAAKIRLRSLVAAIDQK